jgi:Ca-activated chloride channel family protein
MNQPRCDKQFRAFVLLFLLCACVPLSPIVAQSSKPESAVSVLVSVAARGNSAAPPLQAEDVRLLEDNTPRRIVSFDDQSESPLALTLAIDVSGSQEHLLYATKSIAWQLVAKLLRPGKDRIAVASFSNETSVELPLTHDLAQAQGAIDELKFIPPPGWMSGGVIVGSPPKLAPHTPGSTALWDAVVDVDQKVFTARQPQERRTILLLTDGEDTGSRAKLKDAVESAISAGVVVYAIGIGDAKNYEGVDKESLKKIAERSGGEAFFPGKPSDLPNTFTRLEAILRSQYLLTFVPADKPDAQNFRKLKIEIVKPDLRESLRVTFQEGYFRTP